MNIAAAIDEVLLAPCGQRGPFGRVRWAVLGPGTLAALVGDGIVAVGVGDAVKHAALRGATRANHGSSNERDDDEFVKMHAGKLHEGTGQTQGCCEGGTNGSGVGDEPSM